MDGKDLDGRRDLFDYDALVQEPFSKVQALDGRSAIEPFLKLAMMAYTELRRTVKIEKHNKSNNINDKIVALIASEKGERIKGRFTSEFTDN
jgi:predicted RNase H-like nuclease